jgi:hypothetical protein
MPRFYMTNRYITPLPLFRTLVDASLGIRVTWYLKELMVV